MLPFDNRYTVTVNLRSRLRPSVSWSVSVIGSRKTPPGSPPEGLSSVVAFHHCTGSLSVMVGCSRWKRVLPSSDSLHVDHLTPFSVCSLLLRCSSNLFGRMFPCIRGATRTESNMPQRFLSSTSRRFDKGSPGVLQDALLQGFISIEQEPHLRLFSRSMWSVALRRLEAGSLATTTALSFDSFRRLLRCFISPGLSRSFNQGSH